MKYFILFLLLASAHYGTNAQKKVQFLNLESRIQGVKSCNLSGGSLYVRLDGIWTFVAKTDEQTFSFSPEMDSAIMRDTSANVAFIISTNYDDYEATLGKALYTKYGCLGFSIVRNDRREYELWVNCFSDDALNPTVPVKLRENKKQDGRFLE